MRIEGLFLLPGPYSLIAGLLDERGNILDVHQFVCEFEVIDAGDDDYVAGRDYGLVFPRTVWSVVTCGPTFSVRPEIRRKLRFRNTSKFNLIRSSSCKTAE